ncbi:hypothetical protein [Curtobacterium sp. MCBD17_040]|uniref:hypothetical protein n=1 Tax=Curtobacterium sp. MCBD17_040 TaxID=2175674 RepID=UPI000DAAA718|nr:hypothetical protein [Curtobacterium sp. MCBD17_040]WIB65368.1 hypothetical protein DEI94_18345 [Curtobacterium sp. MCBD17_040]
MTTLPTRRKDKPGVPKAAGLSGGAFASQEHGDADDVALHSPTAAASAVPDTAAGRAAARLANAEPVLTDRFAQGRQDYTVERIVVLPALGDAPEQKVRIYLRRDSYAEQSYVASDLLTPTGWERIDSLPGSVLAERTDSPHAKRTVGDRLAQCTPIIKQQLQLAATILS